MSLFKDAYAFFEDIVPADSCQQATDQFLLERKINYADIHTVVDLGCGTGNSVDYFREKKPDIKWIGVDIESSPEVRERRRTDATFLTFDGVHLPFNSQAVDLVYCHQSLEHVHSPQKLVKEIQRILVPGGTLVGATSHLEPYHSYSHWNYTPYGFVTLIDEAGLKVKEMRPGIDGMTLFIRKALGRPKFMNWFFAHETPINGLIGLLGFLLGKDKKEINLLKLMFCGQFVFLAEKEKS